ncbi:MAG: sulfotransferase family protein [Acidimicrobiia bacterium]
MGPKYCFVFGCQRSGTTALTRLLHSHGAVVMGVERYKYLLTSRRGRRSFAPALFEPDRFLDFRPADTNVDPAAGQFTSHYARAERRLRRGKVKYVGDKLPLGRKVIKTVETRMPVPRYIFIYRDLLPVASSFAVRARNPDDRNWPAADDYEIALERWHEAFAIADDLVDRVGGDRIFVVKYERLFNQDARTRDAIFRFLGLHVSPQVQRHFETRTEDWEDRRSRSLALSVAEQDRVLGGLDHDVLERFDHRFEEEVARFGATP